MKHKLTCVSCLLACLVLLLICALSTRRTMASGFIMGERMWIQCWVRDGVVRVEWTRTPNRSLLERLRRQFPSYLSAPNYIEPFATVGARGNPLRHLIHVRTHRDLAQWRIVKADIPVHDMYLRIGLWALIPMLVVYPLSVVVMELRSRRRVALECCPRCHYHYSQPPPTHCTACGLKRVGK